MSVYFCPKCNTLISNESCVVWKKTSNSDVASYPHHNACETIVELTTWQAIDIPPERAVYPDLGKIPTWRLDEKPPAVNI